MTEDTNRPAARELAGVVARGLRSTDSGRATELSKSLGWLFAEKAERDSRAPDFEAVNARINELMENPDSVPPKLRDVASLAKLLSRNSIPSLEEARKAFYQNPKVEEIVTATIQKATREYPTWANVNQDYPSKGTPASGALIEGFGAFLQTLHNKEGINRAYVMAFEEILVSERQDSPLTADVIGWMVEEKSSFPRELHQTINTLSQRYRVEVERFKQGFVEELIDDLGILDYKIRGQFLSLDSNAGRLVEVKFNPPGSEDQITGYVDKWIPQGDLWVMVQTEPDKSGFKHYRLPAEQSISWRLINLNK